jgi:hypothetical protein
MASSGSYNFSIDRDDIINTALQLAGIIGEGETGTTSQLSESALILNMIVKLREADGMPLWALKRGFILPFTGTSSINTNSHVVTTYDTTTLSAASAATDTTLTVTAITGFSDGDTIGIELDDGSMDWTTVNGSPSGTTITITTGVTSAAASGNRVYGYTASSERVQKPLRVLQADVLDVASGVSHAIDCDLSLTDYFNLSDRTAEGEVNQIYYTTAPSSDTALETNGTFYVWPRFADGDSVIEFTYHRPFMDFDSASDEPDFPQAFYLPLTLELATFLGIKGGVTIEERREMRKEAQYYLEQALFTVTPEGSLFLRPE